MSATARRPLCGRRLPCWPGRCAGSTLLVTTLAAGGSVEARRGGRRGRAARRLPGRPRGQEGRRAVDGASRDPAGRARRPEPRGADRADAVRRGLAPAGATILARDLANTRSSTKGPAWLAARATRVARASGADRQGLVRGGPAARGFRGHPGRRRRRRARTAAGPAGPPPDGSGRGRPPARRPGRQGHHVRHRRHLAQAPRGHARDDDRHDRLGGRARRAGGLPRARRTGPGHRPDAVGRERVRRRQLPAGRRRARPTTGRRSRSATPTPRGGWCWPTRWATREPTCGRTSWSTSPP